MSITRKIVNKLPLIILIMTSIVVYIILLLCSKDNDMYFEIASGRDLLNGEFFNATHLNNYPLIVQQWLYAVILALVDKLGDFGIFTFVFIQNLLLWLVSSIFIYRKTKNKKKAIIGSYIATFISYYYMISIRPQIITVIMLIVELILVDMYKEKHNIKYLLSIFPLLILYANIHQSLFLYSIFVIIPFYIDIDKSKHILKCIDWKLVWFSFLFLLCSLCTPYGLDGSLYVVKALFSDGFKYIGIKELQPLPITNIIGVSVIIILAIVIYKIYKKQSNYYVNYYIFSLTILSFISVRHLCIWYIALMFMFCYFNFTSFKKNYIYIITIIIGIFLAVGQFKKIDFTKQYGNIELAILDKNARIYNSIIDIGGWLEYNDFTKVKFDSRIEVFSKEMSNNPTLIDTLLDCIHGYHVNENKTYSIASDDILISLADEYDYFIVKPTDYINRVLEHHNWLKIYDKNNMIIFKNPTN